MNSTQAIMLGQQNKAKQVMVFDWDKAAFLIATNKTKNAGAGLRDDWEWTSGEILRDGKPVPHKETYTYLASTWAQPEISLDDGEKILCWTHNSEWNAHTYWPPSALLILHDPELYSKEHNDDQKTA